jgi:hypothetical protein
MPEKDVSTIQKRNIDPPLFRANFVTTKRIRMLPLANTSWAPTPNAIVTFLPGGSSIPLVYTAFRIKAIHVWAPDSLPPASGSQVSYGIQLTLTGIQNTGVAGSQIYLGDGITVEDLGTTGASRAQVHCIPSREFSAHWWSATDTASQPFLALCQPPALPVSTDFFVVDLIAEVNSTV